MKYIKFTSDKGEYVSFNSGSTIQLRGSKRVFPNWYWWALGGIFFWPLLFGILVTSKKVYVVIVAGQEYHVSYDTYDRLMRELEEESFKEAAKGKV